MNPDIGDFDTEEYEIEADIDLGDRDFESLAKFIADIIDEDLLEVFIEEAFYKQEVEAQNALVQDGYFEAAVLRQAAFVETMLNLAVEQELTELKGSELSDNEESIFRKISNKDVVYLANILDILDEGQYHAFSELMYTRDELAHNWWLLMEEDRDAERVSERIIDLLEESGPDNEE